MNTPESCKAFSFQYSTGILILMLFGSLVASAQEKKAPVPVKPASKPPVTKAKSTTKKPVVTPPSHPKVNTPPDKIAPIRRTVVDRPDHSRIVAETKGRGYVQRPYTYHGREFATRTYVYNGHTYARYYAHYRYRGVYVDVYNPARYYPPAFYGWAYNPWMTPVPYAWGWVGDPWYGYYGYYFAPYAVYPSASAWLTDYLISATLAAEYQAEVNAAAAAQAQAASDAAALTPETKNLIAAEVQRQIALENAEAQTAQNGAPDPASSGIQRMLTDNIPHVFVAGRDLEVTDGGGKECVITEGDALQLTGPPPAGATVDSLVMLSSKGGKECLRGAVVSVEITDLQDMQNHMRETIDEGMAELQANKSTNGLPPLPATAAGPPVQASYAAAAPPPDPNAATEIAEQSRMPDQAEKGALNQAAQTPESGQSSTHGPMAPQTPAPVPIQVSLGQTVDEVIKSFGQPLTIADSGPKQIYVYKDLKVTFKDGKVSDVQ